MFLSIDISSASRQKDLSVSHLYTQLDPFALKLMICSTKEVLINASTVFQYVLIVLQGSGAADVVVSQGATAASTVLTFTYDASLTPSVASVSVSTLSVKGNGHFHNNKVLRNSLKILLYN